MDLFDILLIRSLIKPAQLQMGEIQAELDKKASLSDVYTKDEIDTKLENFGIGSDEVIFDCGQSQF